MADIAVFCASKIASCELKFLSSLGRVRYIIDNDKAKHDTYFNGYRVVPIDTLLSDLADINAVYICATSSAEDIFSQLTAIGVDRDKIYRYVGSLDREQSVGQFTNRRLKVYIATLPKSGSLWLWNNLANSLRLPKVVVHGGDWYSETSLNYLLLKEKPISIGQSHLSPTEDNILILDALVDKIIINTRDPRQAMMSWIFHLDKVPNGQLEYDLFGIPKDYLSYGIEEKVNYQMTCYLPKAVKWLNGWMNVCRSGRLNGKLLMTTQELMANDPEKLNAMLSKFIGSETDVLPSSLRPVKGRLHFRSGATDEWKDRCTKKQIQKMNSLLPKELKEFFRW